MALLVLLPISVIVFSWGNIDEDIWQHLLATQLPRLLANTTMLVIGVGLWTTGLGVSLAWLTAVCEFPGKRWLEWALMLPLAIPTYVVAFVALGIFDFSGPVQTAWRELFGTEAWFPQIRSTPGVIFVMVTVLYPYVYMLARVAFIQQGRELMDAARSLGYSPIKAFIKVSLPVARPAITAGVSLALMETLADFGAVSIFNYDTFTTAIYKAWFGFFSLNTAAQLASLLLLFVFISLTLERHSRSRAQLDQSGKHNRGQYHLTGWHRWAATSYCFIVFCVTFVVPVAKLLHWVIETGYADLDHRFAQLIEHSFGLAGMASLIIVIMAVLVAYGQRILQSRSSSMLVRVAGLGYALPGSVLAVGIMLVFVVLDKTAVLWWQNQLNMPHKQLLVGSIAGLILAYMVRFFAVAQGPIESSFQRIRPSIPEAAHSLGANQWRVLRGIYLPMLVPGMLSALLLAFVDILKEMPATLLMRPFGWDTLAVRIYEMTSEGEWQRAALPALTLVCISIVPVIIMIRRSRLP
jgi:iron(III) transport system permease protein